MSKEPFKDYESYLNSLSIPREPGTEDLTPAEIAQITQAVFAEPQYAPADLLFVFGTSTLDQPLLDRLAQACCQGDFPHLLVTGGPVGRAYFETGRPLARLLEEQFLRRGVPPDQILVQDRSTNTLEDVTFGRELLRQHQLEPQQIAFLSKSHHSGRCLRTLRKFYPSAPLYPIMFDAEYEGTRVSRQDWWLKPVAKSRVYGEFLRIKKYGDRGDIAPL